MPGIQPIISYPGVIAPESVVATDSHGITPNTFLLNILPQSNPISESGDLIIGSGGSRRIWRDCIVDASSVTYDANGLITSLSILDRRWRWSYGRIDGHYNVRNKAGEILRFQDEPDNPQVDTERTPQQLAALLLFEMGEPLDQTEITELPNDYRPEVYWEVANPAEELARLCDLLGCRIVLQSNDRVAIRRIGSGAALPVGPVDQISESVDPPESPNRISILTAPIEYQWDFELEAVGLDRDDAIRRLDDLTYTPDDGWSRSGFDAGFPDLAEDDRKLAQRSVFRWYIVKVPFTYPDPLVGRDGLVTHRDQINLLDRQVNLSRVVTSRQKTKEPLAYGIWWNEDQGINTGTNAEANAGTVTPPPQNEKNKTVLPVGFSIDREFWLVRFSRQVYRLAPEGGDANNLFVQPAILRLRAAFHFRNESRSFRRAERERVLRAAESFRDQFLDLSLRRTELIPAKRVSFPGTLSPDGGETVVEDNLGDIRSAADKLLDIIEGNLTERKPSQARYIGIVPTNLDGAIQSVTYQWTAQGPLTTIQRNQDTGSSVSLPYQLKRRWEKQRAIDNLIDDGQGQNQRRRLELAVGE